MPRGSSPIVRRQRLGAELRRLREHAGLTGEQVVDRVGWAAKSKLSRLENGRSRPDLADVLDLLDLYQVRGRDRDQLVAITREAGNTRGWLRAYPVMTQRQRGYAELEAGSAEIREYALSIVPGLLQTAEYARARILSSPEPAPSSPAPHPAGRAEAVPVQRAGSAAELPAAQEPDTEVAARLARQAVLARQPDPPRYEAVLDEQAVLGRGAPRAVRDGQLAHLSSLMLLPNVTIRVLPREACVGPEFVPYTGFSIYHFSDPEDPETVAVEALARELVITDRMAVQRYSRVFDWLRAAALDPIRSRAWLESRLK
ncbi:helix-turn-helix transcriptional regulator [Catellatospora sp. KI3]|uniref:helix-turn-helix domain-containing protein n=1 Tax=Catellatospora sp. KI3 TaxID=3041620 RepID=UPI0024824CB0|nr:helix-turn-helix transcriptional regulator [Catellatospora sp. KI3]MDI1459843.1 helix-turn-helix transcriptional regulator [Catellatospora sp. KI3]